jgi:dipeptidyl aminopeptidase/acylaminoacyl peptidase
VILLGLFLFVPFREAPPAARFDPDFRFRTVETANFLIHYHQGLDEAAAKVAAIAEPAHERLVAAFGWAPREKTQVVLVDASDFTNGFTATLPRNAMTLLVVPPSVDSTLGEYGDWLEEMFLHEYAHVLTSDPSRGYAGITRRIFGKPVPAGDLFSLLLFVVTAPPNTFLPRWWHEGMATWAETAHSRFGRGRSAYYDMVFRMAVREGNLPSIDRINEALPFWPGGHLPYLYGLRLQEYIAGKYGEEAVSKLNMVHAGRFPYFLNGPPRRLLAGKSYKVLYAEMIAEMKEEQRARLGSLLETPVTVTKELAFQGERMTRPRWSPDGKRIALQREDPHLHAAIVVGNADGSRETDAVRRITSDGSFSWSPDGNVLYYVQAEIRGGFSLYQDLYAHDLRKGKGRRLTSGLRVGEPDMSPDGNAIAAVLSHRGSQRLSILRRSAGDSAREEWVPSDNVSVEPMARVSGPRWSPDGTRIAYVVAANDGRSRVESYDVGGRKRETLFESDRIVMNPAWSRDGKLLVYTSGETGVFNLFAFSIEERSSRQVTHLLGGAFHPEISPDGTEIVFSSYHSRGFRVETVPYDPRSWFRPRDRGLSARREVRSAQEPPSNPPGTVESGVAEPAAYSPLRLLGPRFWLPTLWAEPEDGVAVGAMTAAQDPLGYHTYFVNPAYGTETGKGYLLAAYVYDRLYPTFQAAAYSLPVLYADFHERGDYWERDTGATVRVEVPYYRYESKLSAFFGYRLRRESALTDVAGTRLAELDIFEGRRDNLFAGLEYADAVRYPYSISFEEGRSITLEYRNFSKSIGSDLSAMEYLGSWREYVGMPWDLLRHHVLMLDLRGGTSSGEQVAQSAFQAGGAPDPLNEFPIRGYSSRFRTGKHVATGTLEYRFPIYDLFRGPGTAPLFLDRVHGAVFADAGETWGGAQRFSTGNLLIGAGAELKADLTLGYWLKIEPAVGIAHGFDRDGATKVYVTVTGYAGY